MKHLVLITGVLLVSAANAYAGAKINAKDSDGNRNVVALDSEGTPRTNSDAKTYPTIKDYREGGDIVFRCIEGDDRDALLHRVDEVLRWGSHYSRSRTTAAPCPPCAHTVTSERFLPRRFSSRSD